MSDLKVEGKVSDFCPKCKNCKSTTRGCDGENDWRLTEVECEDPYDGMIKTLDADSDICCSMFTPKPDRACEKCERFDGTYCHGPNGTITISYKALFGEPVNCPSFEEKKEKEPCNTISLLQHELEMDKLRKEIHQLNKEKAAHMKGIERLKKSNNGIKDKYKKLETRIDELIKASKRKDELIQNYREKLKKENEAGSKIVEENVKLENIYFMSSQVNAMIDDVKRQKDIERNAAVNGLKIQIKQLELGYEELNVENEQRKKAMDNQFKMIQDLKKELKKVESHDEALTKHFQNDEKLIDNIQKVIFPQEEGSDYTYSYDEILDKVNDLKSDVDTLQNKNISLNTINVGLAEDRKKLINYMRSLKIASDNYLKEFTYGEENENA